MTDRSSFKALMTTGQIKIGHITWLKIPLIDFQTWLKCLILVAL